MANTHEDEELFVGAVDIDGRAYNVTVRVEFDEIEHVGHLWFREAEWEEEEGLRDHGTLPGRSPAEVMSVARALSEHDLTLRYRRALSQRRRYHGLRQVTQEVLNQIRYLNKVATSMRAGLLDVDEAASEIVGTEKRLHAMVDELRVFAGVST